MNMSSAGGAPQMSRNTLILKLKTYPESASLSALKVYTLEVGQEVQQSPSYTNFTIDLCWTERCDIATDLFNYLHFWETPTMKILFLRPNPTEKCHNATVTEKIFFVLYFRKLMLKQI